MAKFQVFVTKEEGCHYGWEAGQLYTGHDIAVEAEKIEKPTACLKCNTWFQEGQNGHRVISRWPFDDFDDGWDMYQDFLGHICQTCFDEAIATKQFLGGKLKP